MARERITLFVPGRLVRYYSKKVREKPAHYRHLSSVITSARLPITVQRLLAIATFYSIFSFAIGSLVGYVILRAFIPEGAIYYALQQFLGGTWLGDILMPYCSMVCCTCTILWVLISGVVAYKLVEYLILSYPSFISSRRRNEIDIYLPHAVNMMYGMAAGGIGTYDMIKSVAEAKFMFGELSKEFGTIIQLTDVFKEDLLSAMRHVRDTTPSEKLSSFLDDLIFIIKGGGNLSAFLKNKSDEFFEEQEVSFTSYLDFLSVMTETYLAVFLLFPLFLLIVLVVMQIVGEDMLNTYRTGILILLPVATVFFTYLIKSSLPVPPARTEKRVLIAEEDIFARKVEQKMGTYKVRKFRKILKRIKSSLLHPFEDAIYTIGFRIVLFYIAVLVILVTFIASRFLSLRELSIVTLSTAAIPIILFIELRERTVRQIEKRIPEIFKELAILNEAGLSIIEALKVLSTIELGVISKEINIIRRRIEWGEPVTKALRLLELRVRSEIIAKVIPISVKALETSPTYKDAFQTVAAFASAEVGLRERIRSSMLLYIIIIYLSIFVFLLIIYILINNILSAFGGVVTEGVTFMPNFELIKETFYQVSLVVGILSGIIAGVIGSGKVLSGLKHAYVFFIATYILFNYLL
ncbi:type II secretion system F family protein [Archaeoglobus veneficus]|uniref:Type II secretion system F domain protein n=1 Tax=Archaeoglobus veneficus (strain DSM 11195 / SNP6) TaxID=693661 RepID=F2KSR3_ARCVS|nr:type II secretion system F family protein [Archaeoglobus veneficus]AEA46958.1 Type II secretion system F domain protein [Archaeoglobus veneficus SNP6]